jgi:hypothetical protein
MKLPAYQLQNNGSCCSLVALLNARRFHGLQAPRIGSKRYEALVDLAKCRHGATIGADRVAQKLGLRRHRVFVSPKTFAQNLPVMLTVLNPEPRGMTLHSVLVVGVAGMTLDLVNYHWINGPVVEQVSWLDLPMPLVGHANHEAWSLKLV